MQKDAKSSLLSMKPLSIALKVPIIEHLNFFDVFSVFSWHTALAFLSGLYLFRKSCLEKKSEYLGSVFN